MNFKILHSIFLFSLLAQAETCPRDVPFFDTTNEAAPLSKIGDDNYPPLVMAVIFASNHSDDFHFTPEDFPEEELLEPETIQTARPIGRLPFANETCRAFRLRPFRPHHEKGSSDSRKYYPTPYEKHNARIDPALQPLKPWSESIEEGTIHALEQIETYAPGLTTELGTLLLQVINNQLGPAQQRDLRPASLTQVTASHRYRVTSGYSHTFSDIGGLINAAYLIHSLGFNNYGTYFAMVIPAEIILKMLDEYSENENVHNLREWVEWIDATRWLMLVHFLYLYPKEGGIDISVEPESKYKPEPTPILLAHLIQRTGRLLRIEHAENEAKAILGTIKVDKADRKLYKEAIGAIAMLDGIQLANEYSKHQSRPFRDPKNQIPEKKMSKSLTQRALFLFAPFVITTAQRLDLIVVTIPSELQVPWLTRQSPQKSHLASTFHGVILVQQYFESKFDKEKLYTPADSVDYLTELMWISAESLAFAYAQGAPELGLAYFAGRLFSEALPNEVTEITGAALGAFAHAKEGGTNSDLFRSFFKHRYIIRTVKSSESVVNFATNFITQLFTIPNEIYLTWLDGGTFLTEVGKNKIIQNITGMFCPKE